MPPGNHFAKGMSQSSTRSHVLNHSSFLASCSQNSSISSNDFLYVSMYLFMGQYLNSTGRESVFTPSHLHLPFSSEHKMFQQYILCGIHCRTDSNHFYCFMLKVRFYNGFLVCLAGPQGFEPWVFGSEGLRVTFSFDSTPYPN
jgi:hypothetical protein